MTCAQVARCLRQDKVIALIVDRPDYDLIDHQIYYGNRIQCKLLISDLLYLQCMFHLLRDLLFTVYVPSPS